MTDAAEKELTRAAMKNGAKSRCPRCGEGHLFRSYLKVAASCDHCGWI